MSNGTEPWDGSGMCDPNRKLVKDKGPRIDTTCFKPEDLQWNDRTESYQEAPRAGLFITEEDNIPCQEEKQHYTFPNHKTGPTKTVVFDDHNEYCTAAEETRPPLTAFEQDLRRLINKCSMENGSNMPDNILAEYLHACLLNFNRAIRAREQWYGRRVF